MPIDQKKMKALKQAWEFINSASHEEKSELFKDYIENFDTLKAELEGPDNRFNPHSFRAYDAMDYLERFVRRVTGYNPGWIPYKLLEHCCTNSGRPEKYGLDVRELNSFFIEQMVKRGASETQAMKLLVRLRGDSAMSSGHLRELRDTYGDYKKVREDWRSEQPLYSHAHLIARFLEFNIDNLEGDEVASEKAVAAFKSLFSELIELMKMHHSTVAARDSEYPAAFGCVIDWLGAEYDDPLDYFFTHPSHKTVPFMERRKGLLEYLNTVGYYIEHPPE